MKVIVLVGLMSIGTQAQAEINKECWDGTFGYNYVRAIETDLGVEITLQGSTLQLPPLFNNWNHSINIKDYWSGASVHALLPAASQVTSANGDITLSAKTVTVETADGWLKSIEPTLWLEHNIQSLGQSKKLISDVPLHSITATLSEDEVVLTINQARTEAGEQTIRVGCAMQFTKPSVKFPAELKDYLSSSSRAK